LLSFLLLSFLIGCVITVSIEIHFLFLVLLSLFSSAFLLKSSLNAQNHIFIYQQISTFYTNPTPTCFIHLGFAVMAVMSSYVTHETFYPRCIRVIVGIHFLTVITFSRKFLIYFCYKNLISSSVLFVMMEFPDLLFLLRKSIASVSFSFPFS